MTLTRLLALPMFLVLVGCTFNHTVNTTRDLLTDVQLLEQRGLASGRDWVAPRNSTWFVAVANTGPTRSVDQAVSQQLATAMRQHFALVVIGDESAAPAEAVRQGRQNGANFVIYPQLLYEGEGAYSIAEWLDTENTSALGRDQAGVHLLIFDAYTGQLLDAVTLTVKESWLPGINNRVEQLYVSAFDAFARQYSYQQAELPN